MLSGIKQQWCIASNCIITWMGSACVITVYVRIALSSETVYCVLVHLSLGIYRITPVVDYG